MRLGQAKLHVRVLRRIALGQFRVLVLQDITEVRLHRANAGVGAKFAAHRLHGPAVGDAEQADGSADKREVPRLQTRQAVAPRQRVGLRIGQRAIDLGHKLIGDRARVERGLQRIAALILADVPAWSTAGAAIRADGLVRTIAAAVAIGVAASRANPRGRSADARNRPAHDVGIDPRRHRRIDARNPRLDVDAGRAHDALRVSRTPERCKRQDCGDQGEDRAPHLHPPIRTVPDHETSGSRKLCVFSKRARFSISMRASIRTRKPLL
ncbi:hypothetical protein GALL_546120 [mine drainage metagenome]|uniref:Uncharacterized protein n=1 Tax=mine drainage metagenome TaxID=410659 RepID=A0A1J5PJY4_9ZZZZ